MSEDDSDRGDAASKAGTKIAYAEEIEPTTAPVPAT